MLLLRFFWPQEEVNLRHYRLKSLGKFCLGRVCMPRGRAMALLPGRCRTQALEPGIRKWGSGQCEDTKEEL